MFDILKDRFPKLGTDLAAAEQALKNRHHESPSDADFTPRKFLSEYRLIMDALANQNGHKLPVAVDHMISFDQGILTESGLVIPTRNKRLGDSFLGLHFVKVEKTNRDLFGRYNTAEYYAVVTAHGVEESSFSTIPASEFTDNNRVLGEMLTRYPWIQFDPLFKTPNMSVQIIRNAIRYNLIPTSTPR